MAAIEFELNGRPTRVEFAAGTPLLWVLRDVLGLTGTKFGCGRMACGACTVHVDGVARRTCLLPAETVATKRVTTIEGLGEGHPHGRHPVQQAWLEAAVPQCGYCQSGQLMTAAALLATTPQPTDAEIDRAMAGVLCRCGTYQRIRDAIRTASGQPAAGSGDGGPETSRR